MATFKTVEISAKMSDRFKMECRARGHVLHIDQPKLAGGDDSGPTALEFVLLSLAGCIGMIGRIIANQRKLPLRSIEVRVVGELDTDTLMGKAHENRAGFSSISAIVKIEGDMTKLDKQALLDEIDARCPISDNLKIMTPVSFELG